MDRGINNHTEPVLVKNKRKAYLAMCLSTFALFVISALSGIFNSFIIEFLGKNYSLIERMTVGFLGHFGIGVPIAKAALENLFGAGTVFQFISVISIIITMVIPALLFSWVFKISFNKSFCLDGKIIKGFFAFFCANQIITTFVSGFSGRIYDFIVPPSPDIYTGSFTAYSPDAFSITMSILCTCILVPVTEEYVFRGMFFTYLRRYGLAFGIIASATLFGVAHSAPTQSVFAFTFGIISAIAFVITGNIKTSILLHALNNTVSVVFGYLKICVSEDLFYVISCLYTIIITAAAMAGLYKFIKAGGFLDTYFEKEKENDSGLCMKAGMREIICFPMIVYILIYAVDFITQVM